MKVVLSVEARFKLERLCDSVHPKECGGILIGEELPDMYLVKDVFPVPNTSKSPNYSYVDHEWGDHWAGLYARMVRLKTLGSFHSHPDGSIPSAGDRSAYNDRELHMWVIHQYQGEHTFIASKGINHMELELASQSLREPMKPEFIGLEYSLGDLLIDQQGQLKGDSLAIRILELSSKGRSIYLAAIRLKNWRDTVKKKALAEYLHISQKTLSERLKELEKADLIYSLYGEIRLR